MDIKMRDRIVKLLLGMTKIAPMIELTQPFKSFLLDECMLKSFNHVLRYDTDMIATTYRIQIDKHMLENLQYMISQLIQITRAM